MNATPPETNTEYSRAHRGFGGAVAPPPPGLISGAGAVIMAGAVAGALLLIVAEFTPLYTLHTAASQATVGSYATGRNHGYAMLPIAVLALILLYGVWKAESRVALLSIGVLGVIALLIAILDDLPVANATGLVGGGKTHYINAATSPGIGFYLETLGAVLLLISCVCGFVLWGPPTIVRRPPRSARTPGPPAGSAGPTQS